MPTDVLLLLGLFALQAHFGTLSIETILQRAPELWPVGTVIQVLPSQRRTRPS